MKSSKSRRSPDPAGGLLRSPRPPSRKGLLAFGNRSFAPSALSPFLAPQTKIPVLLAPQTQNSRTATANRPNIQDLIRIYVADTMKQAIRREQGPYICRNGPRTKLWWILNGAWTQADLELDDQDDLNSSMPEPL